MKTATKKNKVFNIQKSISKASKTRSSSTQWQLHYDNRNYVWNSKMERVDLVREGVSYGALEVVGKRMNTPISQMLKIVDMPQTTYNKKKKENALLDSRDSEFVLILTELIDFGIEVFDNEEEKFQRWLKKPNVSLGGNTPESLLDTITGIQEVKNALNRIEYGNLA